MAFWINFSFRWKVVQKTVEEHLEREIERQGRRKDEDYDDEVEETLVNEDDEDVYVLSKIADVMHALFIAYRSENDVNLSVGETIDWLIVSHFKINGCRL